MTTIQNALAAIRTAAQNNTATSSQLALSVYSDAGVTGLRADYLSAYNSALDSRSVSGQRADTTAEVQAIVDAYNTILNSTAGYGGTPILQATAAQFNAVGIRGLSGTNDFGTALHLLNESLFGAGADAANTVPELQAMADASKRVIAAAGGNAAQAAALSVQDFTVLRISGVSADNLDAVRKVVRAVGNDLEVGTHYNLQNLVNTALDNSAYSAMDSIALEAALDTANATTLSASVYAKAGIHGVDNSNLASVNSALNSTSIGFEQAKSPAKVQAIVDAYQAILRSADGVAGNTTTALAAAQYNAVGVTGMTEGSALHLLDSVVDAAASARVDTVRELQAMADAANHVVAAAGGTAAQAAALSLQDFRTLGISGVNAANLAAVRMAVQASTTDDAVDTQAELQSLVRSALTPQSANDNLAQALATLRVAAQDNSATHTSPALGVYAAAGASGLRDANLASYNSALDSAAVDGAAVYTTAKVQALVTAYNLILDSTGGYSGLPIASPAVEHFTAVGVTGLSGSNELGTAVRLLDDSLFGAGRDAADTVQELQARADAANHIFAATGGSQAQAASLTVQDFTALDITGVTADNLGAIRTVLQAVSNNFEVTTKNNVQTVVDATLGNSAYSALDMIGLEALLNSANATTLSTSVYAKAGVSGVNSGNLAAINSALNSDAITGLMANTPGEIQGIVNAYNAILSSADGHADNTTAALTDAQYSAVGVTGISGTATEGSALHLLDSVVDASTASRVDSVPELQAMADAAQQVMAAAGSAPAQATLQDLNALAALGITGVTGGYLQAVWSALQSSASGSAVDTQAELQALVNNVIASGPSNENIFVNSTSPVVIQPYVMDVPMPAPALLDIHVLDDWQLSNSAVLMA